MSWGPLMSSVTWPFEAAHATLYRSSIESKPVSRFLFEIFDLKYVKIWFDSNKNCQRRSNLNVVTSRLWRYRATSRQPGLQSHRSVIEASMVEPSQMAGYLTILLQLHHIVATGCWPCQLPTVDWSWRTKQCEWLLGCVLDLACASPTNVDVFRMWMPKAQGRHDMVCKKVPGKTARHQVLNDIIWRAFIQSHCSIHRVGKPGPH